MACLHALRAELARVVLDLLPDEQMFMDGGTLLGAWRDRRAIPHDDDFDLGILLHDERALDGLCRELQRTLPAPYAARLVTSYATKLEVYDPTHGSYWLAEHGANFHHVTVDLMVYHACGDAVTPMYRLWRFAPPVYRMDQILPLRSLELDGTSFPAPADPEGVLRAVYGSLEQGARYDPVSGRYYEGV
jgi:hypothetical protein